MKYITPINPATQETIKKIRVSSKKEIDQAVSILDEVFKTLSDK